MSGWVKVHRRLAGHSIWTGERFTRGQAWVDLILMAAYTDHVVVQGNRAVTVKRGQFLTSQVALSSRWKWNRETVRSFLHLLRSLGMVAIQTSKATDTGFTLVTMLQYELYQGDGHEARALHSAIDSAIQTSIQPASNQHPPYTPKKGKKSRAKNPGPDRGLLDRPRTPVKSGSEDLAGPLSSQPPEPGKEPGPPPDVTGRRVGAGAPRPPRPATPPGPSEDELVGEKGDLQPPPGLGWVPPMSEKAHTRTAGRSPVSRKELTHIEAILPAVVPGTPDRASSAGSARPPEAPSPGSGVPENGRPNGPKGPPGIRAESGLAADADRLLATVLGPPGMDGVPPSTIRVVQEPETEEVARQMTVLRDHLGGYPSPPSEYHVRRLVLEKHFRLELIEAVVRELHGRSGGGSG